MKYLLLALLFTSPLAFADLPTTASEVEIIPATKELKYENFPTIKKEFEGARNVADRDVTRKLCQEWVMQEMAKRDAKYFRAFCSEKKDIVLREYVLTSVLILKTWR